MQSLNLRTADNGIGEVSIDVPSSRVNVLSSGLIDEFRSILDAIERDRAIRAVVIRSAKSGTFVAGADLEEIRSFRSADDARSLARHAHELLDRIAASTKPFVAAIGGSALGGGLELALACHGRIAADSPKTVLALPEVTLGLIPAAGGTQRLPRLVGINRALSMMLTGERVRPRRALQDHLVDAVVPIERLVEEAIAFALRLSHRSARRLPRIDTLLLRFPPFRRALFGKARAEVARRTRGLYEAPYAILEAVEVGLARGFAAGSEKEIEHFGRLAVSSAARNLIWLFDATTHMRTIPRAAQPRAVKKMAVIGAGLMGEGIASVSLPLAEVVLKDLSDEIVGRAKERIVASIDKRVRGGSLAPEEAAEQRGRLHTTMQPGDITGSELVIEAVFEKLELKQRVLAEIEASVGPEAIIASNTSALPISRIAEGARAPERVLGMHYFSPVPKMPLLEIVKSEATADWAEATAHAFGIAQGKTVVVVKDAPGFFTTRVLAPLIGEAVVLLDEGATVETVESSLVLFGFPVGPLTLLDEVGIDVVAHVSRDLGEAFSSRGFKPSESLLSMEAAGLKGRKGGRGFYTYERNRKNRKPNPELERFFPRLGSATRTAQELSDRMVLLMVNESAHALEEGIIASPRDGDVAAILGLGFPPFLGGPFHWVDSTGAAEVVARMRALEEACGLRYRPAPRLASLAESGSRLYA